MRSPLAASLLMLLLLLPAVSHAGDGVLEINQSCALAAGGCFAGDSAGFPVTITGSAPARSFRLTGDLGPIAPGDSAIAVSTGPVTIDLGGFRIFGVVACSGVPASCAPAGSGSGITGGSDVTVRNGAIHGMGSDGVHLAWSSKVEDMSLYHNGGDAIELTGEGLVRGNVITSNGGDGIHCGAQCAIHDNTSTGNGGDGIEVTSGSATGNTAALNGARGGRFGAEVAFASNQFAGNVAPDLDGGHATAGNACADGSCSRRGARRYYVTQTAVQGDAALAACATGFHMAHLAELHTISVLEYDSARGASIADAGAGPPLYQGWIRTGFGTSDTGTLSNCNVWTTSAASSTGSTAVWADLWSGSSATRTSPWTVGVASCSVAYRAWCVED